MYFGGRGTIWKMYLVEITYNRSLRTSVTVNGALSRIRQKSTLESARNCLQLIAVYKSRRVARSRWRTENAKWRSRFHLTAAAAKAAAGARYIC